MHAGERAPESLALAKRRLAVPAVMLIALAAMSLCFLWAAILFDVWMFASGMIDRLPDPPGMTKETQVLIRMAANFAMQAVHAIILVGAAGLLRLRNAGLARAACVAACIPCCGPCFVLGIPFGIWGLTLLANPDIKAAFRE